MIVFVALFLAIVELGLSYCGARFELCPLNMCTYAYTEERECGLFFFYELQPILVISWSVIVLGTVSRYCYCVSCVAMYVPNTGTMSRIS